jgi:S2P endopeptidase
VTEEQCPSNIADFLTDHRFHFQSQPWSARRYTTWLDKTGFSVSVCQFRWYSTAMNRTFVRLAQWRPQFLRTWFTCGVFFGLVAMLLSVFLLSLMVFNTLTRNTVESQVLTPVVCLIDLLWNEVVKLSNFIIV